MFAKAKPRTPLSTQLRQTKLYVSQDNKLKYDGFVEDSPQIRPTKEFVYKPTSIAPLFSPKILEKSCQEKDSTDKEVPLMSKPGRDLVNLMGRVDFCINTHKMYPHLNAIYNIYGKLLRIIEGKRCENTLLVRNENSGPVLLGIYYDFEGDLKTLKSGCYVQLVGRLIGRNRLQTFTVAQVSDSNWQQHLTRIENITKYSLMQNNKHK